MTQKLGNPVFISISKSIEKDKIKILQRIKKSTAKSRITDWMVYFCNILQDALQDSKILPYLP